MDPHRPYANRPLVGRHALTEVLKLQHEIYLLGEIIASNAAMSEEDREALKRQISVRTAHMKILQRRLDSRRGEW
jgi:hypothetical protein